MVIFDKVQKSSRLVRNVVKKLDYLQFTSKDPSIFKNEYLPIYHSVLIPFQNNYLAVEITELDFAHKVQLRLRGLIDKDSLESYLDTNLTWRTVSVGELTVSKDAIVNYDEHFRKIDIIHHAIDFYRFNIGQLDELCNYAINQYLCGQTFGVDKKFYIDGGYGLNFRILFKQIQ